MKTALAFLFLTLGAIATEIPPPATNTPPVKIRFQFKPILPK